MLIHKKDFSDKKIVDLSNELHAICSNNSNMIAVGGESKQVDIHLVENIDEEEGFLESPELAMKFSSKVTKIEWINNYLLGFSEDDHLQIYNCETKQVLHCL
jgi:hypothetical protein